MAALGTSISALQNTNSASAVNLAQNTALVEYGLKMNLPSLPNYVGAILTLLIHELSDYPQTAMPGIMAAKFFP